MAKYARAAAFLAAGAILCSAFEVSTLEDLLWQVRGVGQGTTQPRSITYATAEEIAEARRSIETIPIKGRSASTGYSRDLFLENNKWPSVGGGCTLRDRIIARDMTVTARKAKPRCRAAEAVLIDPYSNKTVALDKAELEHVVALKDAYVKGGRDDTFTPTKQWPTAEQMRHALAADPDNILMVSERFNAQKKSSDIATWVPPHRAYRCTYSVKTIKVKKRYGIWTSPAENQALRRYLSECPTSS